MSLDGDDMLVGRTIYGVGDYRLQEAGKWYGPEGPGPRHASGEVGMRMLLCFADKRGYRIHPFKEEVWPTVNAIEAPLIPMYEKVGCHPTHPEDSMGYPGIATSWGVSPRAGRVDGSFEETEGWSRVGGTQMGAFTVGEPASGSVFLTAIAPPGGTVMPRSTWATEVMTVVVVGSCSIEGARYEPGDIRIQESGVPHPEITHGDDELQVMIVVGDRRLARPTVDEGDPAAQAWVDDFARLLERVDLVSVAA
jgi:hypothetical protein